MRKIINLSAVILLIAFSSCSKGDYEALNTETGTGGSTARFTVLGDYLYTVDLNSLKVFDIHQPSQPSLIGTKYLGIDIETIFNNGRYLFIGSSNGVYILDVTIPSNPVIASNYQHVHSCDPVIADSVYAYVTLSSTHYICGNTTNELQVLNISNVNSPSFIKSYNMTSPLGLGKNDSVLFVCDGLLKVFDCKDPLNITLKNTYTADFPKDLIVNDSVLIVSCTNGILQYLINGYNLDFLCEIK